MESIVAENLLYEENTDKLSSKNPEILLKLSATIQNKKDTNAFILDINKIIKKGKKNDTASNNK